MTVETLKLVLRYIPDIQIAGGKVVYVPILPPPEVESTNSSAAEWQVNLKELESAITESAKMLVRHSGTTFTLMLLTSPRLSIRRQLSSVRTIFYTNPLNNSSLGKMFSLEELQAIGDICVKHGIIILSDEVIISRLVQRS